MDCLVTSSKMPRVNAHKPVAYMTDHNSPNFTTRGFHYVPTIDGHWRTIFAIVKRR